MFGPSSGPKKLEFGWELPQRCRCRLRFVHTAWRWIWPLPKGLRGARQLAKTWRSTSRYVLPSHSRCFSEDNIGRDPLRLESLLDANGVTCRVGADAFILRTQAATSLRASARTRETPGTGRHDHADGPAEAPHDSPNRATGPVRIRKWGCPRSWAFDGMLAMLVVPPWPPPGPPQCVDWSRRFLTGVPTRVPKPPSASVRADHSRGSWRSPPAREPVGMSVSSTISVADGRS